MSAHRNIKQEIQQFWDDKYKVLGSFIILIGLFLASITFDRPSVKSQADLHALSGRLTGFSFTEGSRGTRMYYLGIDTSPRVFQIPADFLNYFERSNFEKDLSNGSVVTVEFPISSDTISSKPIRIFSIYSGGHCYLHPSGCIRSYNHDWYFPAGVFILGFIVFLFRSYYLSKYPKSRVGFFS